ncbi:hypothetical protein H2203_008094 [Taxawa tesnikishii (nom. ined.)]|nr:hypothetical protein H2203_008094 [Dothideales sp. JES 119]
MRNAVIEFLMRERDEEQLKNQAALAPSEPTMPAESTASFESSAASPWSSYPSASSSSAFSSPDLLGWATPASLASPAAQPATLSRQPTRSTASPPALDQMTSVFSLSSQTQPKTRVRRKMTETEKIEYRKRRIVKACDKCAKRKRKCHHNQAQMETLSQKGASKRSVTTSQRSKAPAAETQPPPPSSLADFSDDPFAFLSTDAAMTLTVLDETNSNFDFGDMVDFNFASQAPMSLAGETQPWPWSNTQDFTLIDAPLADLAAGNDLFYGVTEPLAPTHTFHAHAAQRPNATSVQESAAIYSRHNAYSDLVQGTVQTRTIANGTAQPLLQSVRPHRERHHKDYKNPFNPRLKAQSSPAHPVRLCKKLFAPNAKSSSRQ